MMPFQLDQCSKANRSLTSSFCLDRSTKQTLQSNVSIHSLSLHVLIIIPTHHHQTHDVLGQPTYLDVVDGTDMSMGTR